MGIVNGHSINCVTGADVRINPATRILYHCIFDERETLLNDNIEAQTKKEFAQNPDRQQQQKELLQKIPKFFFLHTNLCFDGFKCFPEKPMNRQHSLSDNLLEILSPPPDLV